MNQNSSLSTSEKVNKTNISVSSISISGPLPIPQVLEGYEKVLPGAADRIISMAEKESSHRHEVEKSSLKVL